MMNKFLVTIVYFLVYHITKKNRIDLFERILATDAEYAYKYAKYYLQKRFILAEPVIQDSDRSSMYLRLESYLRIKEYTLIPQNYEHIIDGQEFLAEEITSLGYGYINTPKHHISLLHHTPEEVIELDVGDKDRIILNKNDFSVSNIAKGDIVFIHQTCAFAVNKYYLCVCKIVDLHYKHLKEGYVLISLERIF